MRLNGDDQSNAESCETLRGELAGGVVRGGDEARERPREVAPCVDALEFAGAENGVENSGAPTGLGVAHEKEILFPHGTRTNAIFYSEIAIMPRWRW